MNFSQLIQEIGLSKRNAEEVFSVSKKQFEQWWLRDAPLSVTDQLRGLNRVINKNVQKWVAYARWHYDVKSQNPLGIPSYVSIYDFHACDPSLAKVLLFLPLYNTFVKKLIEALAQEGIQARPSLIDCEGYATWLLQNDFESCIGAKLVYASLQMVELSSKAHHA